MIRSYGDNASSIQLFHSVFLHSLECSGSRRTILTLMGFSIANMLLVLPLGLFVLYLGYQRWRQQRRLPSHADIFTYHSVAMEMFTIVGCLLYWVGSYTNLSGLVIYSLGMFSSTWSIKILFHTLTCLERYLAVVHPVTYLRLKNKGGARIRNVCIGCVWLACFVWGGLMDVLANLVNTILYLCLLGFASAVICFCCIAVLRALRRPGPSDVGGSTDHVDQIKRRASNTIVSIMAVLLLCLGGMLLGYVQVLQELSDGTCVVMSIAAWFSLPSSFVLPLLFLHRAGKLPRCQHSSEQGQGSEHDD